MRNISTECPPELEDLPAPAKGVIEIYTDGACSGNPGPCGYGVVFRFGKHYKEISEFLGQGTNNIAELTAIKVALEEVKDPKLPTRVFTDSNYSIGVLTKNWKAKANQELIAEIKKAMKPFGSLEFVKVKGHSGDPLNDRADYLATSSVELGELL